MALDEDVSNPASFWNQLAHAEKDGTAQLCPCGESNPGHYDSCYFCQRPGGPQ